MITTRAIIKAVATAASCVCVYGANAAETSGTETAKPMTHFEKRCADFRTAIGKLPANTTGTVVLLGDSITEANPLASLAGMPVVNEGISGDEVDSDKPNHGARKRLELVTAARPARVYVLLGINDFWNSHKSPEHVAALYGELVRDLKVAAPTARLYLQTVLPTSGNAKDLNAKVTALNKEIQRLAMEHCCVVVDLNGKFRDKKGELRAECTTDGVHLSEEGYGLWNAILSTTNVSR